MPALLPLISFLLLPPAPEYAIAGTVVDAVSGRPLAQARVYLASSARQSIAAPVVTGADGRFRFAGLPADKYSLSAERLGYARQAFGAHRLYARYSTGIVVGEHDRADNVVFRMIPGAVITGTVTEQQGEPVPGMTVAALQLAGPAKQHRFINRFSQSTDDRGEYRIPNLPGGTFAVLVSGQPSQEAAAREPVAYTVTWFPNTTSPDAAATVKLQPGQETRADVTVPPVPAARLFVEAPPADADTKQYVTLTAETLSGVPAAVMPSRWLQGSGFVFDRVPVGHYTLHLVRGTRFAAAQEIDVVAPQTRVAISDAAPARVSIRVAFTGKLPATSPVSVVLQSPSTVMAFGQVLQPDGNAILPAVLPGRYLPVVSQGGITMAVSSMKVRGAAQSGIIATIPPTGQVELDVTVETSAVDLTGRVTCNGTPRAGALVMLVQRATWEAIGGYRYDQSDSDGSFNWKQVPAGDYFMFAFEEGAPEDYDDPAVIHELMPTAQGLRVTGDLRQTVKLELRCAPAR